MSRNAPSIPRLQAMQARWLQWQQRFDARSARERLLMGASGLALTLALADLLWLSPASATLKRARLAHQSALETQTQLKQDLQRVAFKTTQQAQQQRNDLDTWRARARETEAALQAHERMLIGPERMVALIEDLLAQQASSPGLARRPVRVRGMQSLPRTDLLAAANPAPAAPAATAAATTPAVALPSLYRHGVEITLEGGFIDLMAYLSSLEALPQRLQWGSLNLQVQQHPTSLLTLRIYTLSRDRHWLEI